MASGVVDVLKICGRNRNAALKMLLQQSTEAAEFQCRPHVERCSRCWMSYDCHNVVGHKRPVSGPFQFPLQRGLRYLSPMHQKICKKYDSSGTDCCSSE